MVENGAFFELIIGGFVNAIYRKLKSAQRRAITTVQLVTQHQSQNDARSARFRCSRRYLRLLIDIEDSEYRKFLKLNELRMDN